MASGVLAPLLVGGENGLLEIWAVAKRAVADALSFELVARLEGHSGTVMCTAVSPDANLAASGSYDNSIRLWDVATHVCLGVLTGHDSSVRCLAFGRGPTTSLLASASDDGTVRVWSVTTRALGLVCLLDDPDGCVHSVVFTNDGAGLLAADESARLHRWAWDAEKSEFRKTAEPLVLDAPVFGGLVWSENDDKGGLVVSAHRDSSVRTWSCQSMELAHRAMASRRLVECVAAGSGETRDLAATGSDDGTVSLWEISTMRRVKKLAGHDKWVLGVCFGPGRVLASVSADGTLQVWDAVLGESLGGCSIGRGQKLHAVNFILASTTAPRVAG